MNALYENVLVGLLVESKTDTVARLIVKGVMRTITGRIDKINERSGYKCLIKNLWPGRDEFMVKLTITIKKKSPAAVNTGGSWTYAKNLLDVMVYINSPDGTLHKNLLSIVQKHAYETIRHEVEHSLQPHERGNVIGMDDELGGDDDGDEEPEAFWRDPKAIQRYFLYDKEIAAFVTGLYQKARRLRMPFEDVMYEKLADYKKLALHHGADKDKINVVFRKIRDVWVEYAKMRFPEAEFE